MMENTYWHRQTPDAPLFPELLWSRPENKRLAGKLLIIGGNAHGFAAPAEAYQAAEAAGAGTARVILPDSIKTYFSRFQGPALETEFAPANPSGSFSQRSLDVVLEQAVWADGVLLAGDLGRNSETAIVLEKLLEKYSGQLTLTKDAVDYFKDTPLELLGRPGTTLVVSLAQLQKIVQKSGLATPITFDMSLMKLVETLHELTELFPAHIIVKQLTQIIVASGGQVSTTRLAQDKEIWRVQTAARAAVWNLQNPAKPFQALTTAIAQTP